MYRLHPVGVDCARRVQGFLPRGVDGCRVVTVVRKERSHSISYRDRIVVGELGHW